MNSRRNTLAAVAVIVVAGGFWRWQIRSSELPAAPADAWAGRTEPRENLDRLPGKSEPASPGGGLPGARHAARGHDGLRVSAHDAAPVSIPGTREEMPDDNRNDARQRRLRQARAGGFPVPAAFAGSAVPVFVREVKATAPAEADGPAEMNLTPAEEAAVTEAADLFFDGLAAAPTADAESAEYADWWAASRQRSDSYLRAVLGWQRYNALTAEAARAWIVENAPDGIREPAVEQ